MTTQAVVVRVQETGTINPVPPTKKFSSDMVYARSQVASTVGGIVKSVPTLVTARSNLQDIIEAYSNLQISIGRAMDLSGLHYDELVDIIKKRGGVLHFGPETVHEAEEELIEFKKWYASTTPKKKSPASRL